MPTSENISPAHEISFVVNDKHPSTPVLVNLHILTVRSLIESLEVKWSFDAKGTLAAPTLQHDEPELGRRAKGPDADDRRRQGGSPCPSLIPQMPYSVFESARTRADAPPGGPGLGARTRCYAPESRPDWIQGTESSQLQGHTDMKPSCAHLVPAARLAPPSCAGFPGHEKRSAFAFFLAMFDTGVARSFRPSLRASHMPRRAVASRWMDVWVNMHEILQAFWEIAWHSSDWNIRGKNQRIVRSATKHLTNHLKRWRRRWNRKFVLTKVEYYNFTPTLLKLQMISASVIILLFLCSALLRILRALQSSLGLC